MSIQYYGIFDNGVFITKGSIKELSNLLDVKYIIRREFYDQYTAVTQTYYQYSHTLVDLEDKPINLSIGNFALIDIGVDRRGYNRLERDYLVKNLNTHEIHKFTNRNGWEVTFLTDDIIPKLMRLNELGSYEMYQKSLEFDSLKEEIENLKEELEKLKEENSFLAEKIRQRDN